MKIKETYKTFEECKQALYNNLTLNKSNLNNQIQQKELYKDFIIINEEVSNYFKINYKQNVLLTAFAHKEQQKSTTKVQGYFLRANYKFLTNLYVITATNKKNEKGESLFTLKKFNEIIKSKSAFYRIKDEIINNNKNDIILLAHMQHYAGYKVADEVIKYINYIAKQKKNKANNNEFGTNYAIKKGFNEQDAKIFKTLFEKQGGKNIYFQKVKDLLKKIQYTKFKGWKFAALTKAQRDILIKRGTNVNYFIKLKLSNSEVYALNLPSAENIKKECRKIVCTKEQTIKEIKKLAQKIKLNKIQKNTLYFCNKYNYDIKTEIEQLTKTTKANNIQELYNNIQKLIKYNIIEIKNNKIKTNLNEIFKINYFNKVTTTKYIQKR